MLVLDTLYLALNSKNTEEDKVQGLHCNISQMANTASPDQSFYKTIMTFIPNLADLITVLKFTPEIQEHHHPVSESQTINHLDSGFGLIQVVTSILKPFKLVKS